MHPQSPADYRVSNYWTSTNPDSHFVTGVSAAHAPADRRLTLRNRQFAEHTTCGATTKRMLAPGAEIRTVPQDEFLIRLPENPKPAERLNRLPE